MKGAFFLLLIILILSCAACTEQKTSIEQKDDNKNCKVVATVSTAFGYFGNVVRCPFDEDNTVCYITSTGINCLKIGEK